MSNHTTNNRMLERVLDSPNATEALEREKQKAGNISSVEEAIMIIQEDSCGNENTIQGHLTWIKPHLTSLSEREIEELEFYFKL